MNNHYHLLIETPEPNLVKGMTRLNGTYTQYFNQRHKRVGHLFQGRYKSTIVEKDNYLLELCRYIVLNPLRANIVKTPEEWKWSSYRATIEKDLEPAWFNSELVLNNFNRAKRAAIKNYIKFVKEGVECESPWSNLVGQIWLGGKDFINGIESKISKKESKEIPYEQRNPLRVTKEEIFKDVKRIYGISSKENLNRNNKGAYKLTVYLLRRAVNLGVKEVAYVFNISEGMVSRIDGSFEQEEKYATEINSLCKKYKVQT